MVKPYFLRVACASIHDSLMLGNICRKLGGQDINLNEAEQILHDMIVFNMNEEFARAQKLKENLRKLPKRKVAENGEA